MDILGFFKIMAVIGALPAYALACAVVGSYLAKRDARG